MDISMIPEGDRQPRIAIINIWTEFTPDQQVDDMGRPVGEPQYREVDMIEYARAGTVNTTKDKVARLQKHQILWPLLKDAYEAWKSDQEAPVDGTPLAAWPGIRSEQLQHCKMFNLHSVQDVAAMNDAACDSLGMGSRQLRDQAKAFIEVLDKTKNIDVLLAGRDEKISHLTAENDEFRSAIADMKAEIEILKANQKKKPGRKPRAEMPQDVAAGLRE